MNTLVETYVLPPDEIERRSLAFVDSGIGATWSGPEREVAKRMAYSVGDLSIAGLVRIHPAAIAAGLSAIQRQAPIVCDVRMVAAGLRKSASPIHTAIAQDDLPRTGLPRSVEGIRSLRRELEGAIVVIGNAPTALLALLDMIDAGECRPALIIGIPVGFVAAAESKQELMQRDVPYITVEGTRGGSPIAAAATNALLMLAEHRD